VPSDPGWSFESAYYHATAEAGGGSDFERGGGIQTGIKSPSDFFMFTPTYAFKTPIFGAQAALGTTIVYGEPDHYPFQVW
jgi:hypothetical protein